MSCTPDIFKSSQTVGSTRRPREGKALAGRAGGQCSCAVAGRADRGPTEGSAARQAAGGGRCARGPFRRLPHHAQGDARMAPRNRVFFTFPPLPCPARQLRCQLMCSACRMSLQCMPGTTQGLSGMQVAIRSLDASFAGAAFLECSTAEACEPSGRLRDSPSPGALLPIVRLSRMISQRQPHLY